MFAVLGTSALDVFLTGFDRLPAARGDEFTSESSAFLDDPVTFALGGNGANSAYVLAGLDEPVALLSALGRDPQGDLVLGWLEGRGVALDAVRRDPLRATACTVVALDRAQQRLSLHHPGASHGYTPEHVPSGLLERMTVLLVSGYHLLPFFRHGGYRKLLRAACQTGVLTALDVGPVIDPIAGIAELAPLLPLVDYLIANEHELRSCAGTDDLEAACSAFAAAGAGAIVVKRGRSGASLRAGSLRLDVPGFEVDSTGTVGAGDAFNAGFLACLVGDGDLERALRFGSAVAACVVAAPRGVLASPDRARVEALLAHMA